MTAIVGSMPVARTVAELRAIVADWRADGHVVALVPTMGALHAGHVSLVDAARARGARVVVSIFVNPTQFAPTEDFSKYPRTFEDDCAKLAAARADLVYAPDVEEIYPEGFVTTVTLAGPAKAGLEDRFRPTHFDGVATVVAKLFTQARPDIAIFGEKDYQQLLVVTRMARDLDLAVEVIGAPTIREPDGLALSSRNRYLSPGDRETAIAVPAALKQAIADMKAGVSISQAERRAVARLEEAGFTVDYVAVRRAGDLSEVQSLSEGPLRILTAARIGATRLIDNMAV